MSQGACGVSQVPTGLWASPVWILLTGSLVGTANLPRPQVQVSAHVTTVLFFFQAEDGIRDYKVTGVQTCALPIYPPVPGGVLAFSCIHAIARTPPGTGGCVCSMKPIPSASSSSRRAGEPVPATDRKSVV